MNEVSTKNNDVNHQIVEVIKLLASFTVQAAKNLYGAAASQSGVLSTQEMSKRVTAALAALKGETSARSSAPHAYEQFNLTEIDTDLGRQYSFTLQPGQCIRDIFDAANTSYDAHASDAQKNLISAAVYKGSLYNDPKVDEPVTEVTTIVVRPVIKGSWNKTLDQQMDRTGKLIFIDSEDVHGKPRPEITAIAALKLDKSVANGILVRPDEPDGDALENKVVRALGGGAVGLYSVGLHAIGCYDVGAFRHVVCAGSGSASRN